MQNNTTVGIPVPKEGTPEFEKMNKMAKKAIPIVLLIFIFSILEQQAFGMIFINIGEDLNQASLAPLITSLPGIVLGIVCVIYGSLGDFVSLRKMTILGILIFVAGSIIGVLFGHIDIWFVIIARMLQAAGGQVAGSVFLVLVSKYIKKSNRVIYYGIFVAVFRFSAAIGVLAAGYISLINWQLLFALPIISILFIPILIKNLPDQKAKGAKIDWAGFTLIGAFAGAVTMFFTNMNFFWGILIIITAVAFGLYVKNAKDPFITPKFFKNVPFLVCMAVIFIGYFFSYTLNAAVDAIGVNVYGLTSAEVSSLLVWSILLAAILGFVCGPVVKKIGRVKAIIMALSFMGFGLIILAFLIPYGPILALGLGPCFYYIGTSFFYSPIVDTATLTVESEESGRVLGVNDLVQAITGSVGVALFGGMMSSSAMSGSSIVNVQSGLASTYANVFLLGGTIILMGLILFLVFKNKIYKNIDDKMN